MTNTHHHARYRSHQLPRPVEVSRYGPSMSPPMQNFYPHDAESFLPVRSCLTHALRKMSPPATMDMSRSHPCMAITFGALYTCIYIRSYNFAKCWSEAAARRLAIYFRQSQLLLNLHLHLGQKQVPQAIIYKCSCRGDIISLSLVKAYR